ASSERRASSPRRTRRSPFKSSASTATPATPPDAPFAPRTKGSRGSPTSSTSPNERASRPSWPKARPHRAASADCAGAYEGTIRGCGRSPSAYDFASFLGVFSVPDAFLTRRTDARLGPPHGRHDAHGEAFRQLVLARERGLDDRDEAHPL